MPEKPRKNDEKRDFAVFRDLWLSQKSWRKMAKEKKIDLAPANKMSYRMNLYGARGARQSSSKKAARMAEWYVKLQN